MANTLTMTTLAVHALEEKKANAIKVIGIDKVSVIADYFVIASGTNKLQVQAMADEVEEVLCKAGYEPKHIEGYLNGNWILMDYGDLVLHIFDEENRVFYDLERIWRDGEEIPLDSLK